MLDTIDDDMPVPVDAGTRNAAHIAATKLIDENVYDAVGRRVGEIEELILDTRTGCVRYVVLRFEGFLGIGRQRFAIPWQALTPDPEYHRCVLDVAHASA